MFNSFSYLQTVLERNHDDWLEKEIDTERQVTELEEQLQKYKTESSHRERDNARLQQQLQDRTQEIQTFKEKVSNSYLENYGERCQ